MDAERERLERVEAMRKKALSAIKAKAFNRWRHWSRRASRRRLVLADFPPAPAGHDLVTQTQMLATNRSPSTLKSRLSQSKELELAMKATSLQDEFAEKLVLAKVDWESVKPGSNVKILLVIGEDCSSDLSAVLKHKMSGGKEACDRDTEDVLTCTSLANGATVTVRMIQHHQVNITDD